ncbi:MAG: hypothetical protein WCR33_01145 [Bacilli bacterium]
MEVILVILGLFFPRVLLFFASLMTNWFDRSFETWWCPLIGFVFVPYTTLAYVAAMLNNNHALTGGWLMLFIAAIVVDVSNHGEENHGEEC